ncbi:acylneuraminate cytidylyltransferase family protein [Bradyrhizobium japonicum]|uniref:acylneuraminate cytidylyltransferase family protein n=1 Tax=Bradyrhizobium japonicum TaxID=375 RepID=UPI001BAACAEC|nr:acylneuraminate cytidylyltransferase family protein [Bradyrhizobium japonicum]MBR0994720.1 acylneuraminate cytidylyltransferase family protein [Bradyrhizobium japonicum]
MKTLAIIPARGGSKRLPGKNTKSFLGVPLIAWSIRFAQRQQRFDKVIVSTDAEEIADASRAEGVDVPYLRPAALATDTATSAAVALDILARERQIGNSFDLVALLQPTSPVREPPRWTEAFAHIDRGVADAVIGVAPAHPHPNHAFHWEQGGKLRPFAEGKQITLRSQELPPVVYIAGNMYLIRSTVLEAQGGFFPPRTVGVLCDQPCEAVDIDTEADWVAAEALAKHYGKSP